MAQSTPAVTIVADRLYSLIGLCIGCPSMSSIHVFLKISDHRSSFLDKQIRGWPGFTPPRSAIGAGFVAWFYSAGYSDQDGHGPLAHRKLLPEVDQCPHTGDHRFFFAAGHRSAAAKGGRDRLARLLGAVVRRESASISGGLLSFPSGTPAWRAVGRSLAARAIAAPAHWLPAFTRGEARRVAGPAPCDVTPRRRSEATSTGARRMAWGGVGYQVAQNGQESLARGQTRGSVGPQARATPIAAPSRERSDGVGGGPRRQEPQRVAVGDKQQRGMDAAPPC